MLTNIDENGKSYESELPIKINNNGEKLRAKSTKLNPLKLTQIDDEGETTEITNFTITDYNTKKYSSLKEYNEDEIKPLIANLDYKEFDLKVETAKANYYYDKEKETLIEEIKGKKKELGCGKIVIKTSYKKATKTKDAFITITIELTPDYQKDYEIIPYSPSKKENTKWIANFMAKYISKPFKYLENIIGVEVNFNKIFYKPEQLREVSTIVDELAGLEKELSNLEKELAL